MRKRSGTGWLPREGWNYAILLVLLLATGTLALRSIIGYIADALPPAMLFPVAAALTFLLLGFMLIAGVFALYAIRFSAHAESLRRINALVDAMDYIRDPVLVLDRSFKLTGANPAAREMLGTEKFLHRPIGRILPFLSQDAITRLGGAGSGSTAEIEATAPSDPARGERTYRIRAYPSAHITVLLVTDITGLAGIRARQRQNTYLQLIGHIARGVATDFNDLLCGISGHAALLARGLPAGSPLQESLRAINDCTDRGIRVGSHLVELASYDRGPRHAVDAAEHMDAAVSLLRSGLDPTVQVELEVALPIPILGISGRQLEQIVHSLGLLAADTRGREGRVGIYLAAAGASPLFLLREPGKHAAVLAIHSTRRKDLLEDLPAAAPLAPDQMGVVESVVDSIVKGFGGAMEVYRLGGGDVLYRILLPLGSLADEGHDSTFDLPEELGGYLSGKRILIASQAPAAEILAAALLRADCKLLRAEDIVATLTLIEQHADMAAIVLDQAIMGQQVSSLLRAIGKICPGAGIVLIPRDTNEVATKALEPPEGTFMLAPNASIAELQRAILSAISTAPSRTADESTSPA